ncbi:hypothetical protein PACTADRAFT_49893 [Pachysolen tannophilus NRRL Y-2460]|uniref:Uncharacterized protein n=1 Tax=Pachysolen tannophilus NRRL Y-2460 TaxID=669874 RepID=A0A1E4TTT1_PACTA|nr:hypothetical protein PACTADRAFT_49893 [Pachysolen tannophilus NRRL Y-2460]
MIQQQSGCDKSTTSGNGASAGDGAVSSIGKRTIKKFKSQSVNNFFKQDSGGTTNGGSGIGSGSNNNSGGNGNGSGNSSSGGFGNNGGNFVSSQVHIGDHGRGQGLGHGHNDTGAGTSAGTGSGNDGSNGGGAGIGGSNNSTSGFHYTGASKNLKLNFVNGKSNMQQQKSGIKTLSLSSGPKLKIIPSKKLIDNMDSNNFNGQNSLIDQENYWKKSRSNSPIRTSSKFETHINNNNNNNNGNGSGNSKLQNIIKEEPAVITKQVLTQTTEEIKKPLVTSRFNFANLSSTSGFNWADMEDDDDSFNEKIWNNSGNTASSSSSILAPPQLPGLQQQPQQQQLLPQQQPAAAAHSAPHSAPSTASLPVQASSPISPAMKSNETASSSASNINNFSKFNNHQSRNNWGAPTSPVLEFRRNTTSGFALNDNNNNNDNTNNNNNNNNNGNTFYGKQHQQQFDRNSAAVNSMPVDSRFSFEDPNSRYNGNEPTKQELYNPITGIFEAIRTVGDRNHNHNNNNNNNRSTRFPQHRSLDSSFTNDENFNDTTNNSELWKSNSVWNSRENSAHSGNNTLKPTPDHGNTTPWTSAFDMSNGNSSISDQSLTTAQSSPVITATTPNNFRGASRFFPSPQMETKNDFFIADRNANGSTNGLPKNRGSNVKKNHESLNDSTSKRNNDNSMIRRKLESKDSNHLITRSQFELPLEQNNNDNLEEYEISLPSMKYTRNITDSKETIYEFIKSQSQDSGILKKHPEGFSSTFYKRGVNNFMFVRELQSKVAINKIRGYDYAEFRINIPLKKSHISHNEDDEDHQTRRIKKSYIINIDVKELDGKQAVHKHNKPLTSTYRRNSSTSANSNNNIPANNTYIRPGYHVNSTTSKNGYYSNSSYKRAATTTANEE